MRTLDVKQAEFDPYYGRYIAKVQDYVTLWEGFEMGRNQLIQFFESIPDEKHGYRYAPKKWSVKEVLQHLIDTERIFMYRCFRIARHDSTPLAGFDQNVYIEPSKADQKSMAALLDEYKTVRQSFITMLQSFQEADLKYIGNSNNGAMSARAAAFVVIGHEIWHMDSIKERYL